MFKVESAEHIASPGESHHGFVFAGNRQIARLAGLMSLLLVIVEQYLTPTIANSIQPLRTSNWAHMLERVLKLSLPTLYGWIIMFYCLFHVWLNILAEVTYFGDREFYKARARCLIGLS
jgi:diacylglycerol O-acyltransferase 1